MDRKTAFLLCVQTGAIALAASGQRGWDFAVSVVAHAATIQAIPDDDDLAALALDYLNAQQGLADWPEWAT